MDVVIKVPRRKFGRRALDSLCSRFRGVPGGRAHTQGAAASNPTGRTPVTTMLSTTWASVPASSELRTISTERRKPNKLRGVYAGEMATGQDALR